MPPEWPDPLQVETPRGRFAVRRLGTGPNLVLVHGWPQSSRCWRPVAERIAHRFRLTLPDLRGLGDSNREGGPGAYRKSELAADLWSVMDALELDSFGLVGHDWGGAVAQEMVLARPRAVTRLALINICVINNRRGNTAAQDELNAAGNRPNWYQHFQQVRGLPEALIPGNERAWLECFLEGACDRAALDEYARCYAIAGTPGCAANLYRAFPDDIRRWSDLDGTRLPVEALFIHGKRDRVVIPRFLDHAEDCFESLRIERIDAGHFVPEERPDEVAQWLSGFFT